MLRPSYFFLISSLPDLTLGKRPEISFSELLFSLRLNLSEEDLDAVQVFRRYFDIWNIRAILLGSPFDHRGNFLEKELDEALLIRDFLPDYILDFWYRYPDMNDRAAALSQLFSAYFLQEAKSRSAQRSPFLRDYLLFERESRLVLLALRCKAFRRDLETELQFEDSSDPLVASLLLQKEGEFLQVPSEYQDLKDLFDRHHQHPLQWYQVYLEYRLAKIQDLLGVSLFSLDAILAYLARVVLVEQWAALSPEVGAAVFEKFLSEEAMGSTGTQTDQ